MRHVLFNEDSEIVSDINLTSLRQIAIILENADYGDWLEGLGQPMCHADLQMWHEMGKFLRRLADDRTA